MNEALTIKDQIKKLIELQKLDADIYALKRDLRQKPEYLTSLKQDFENKKANLILHEEQYKSLLIAHKTLEGDLKTQDEAVAKANSQLSLLKTNKEYTAKLTEIEHIKADKSLIEEKLILSYDTLDAAKAAVEKEKGVVAQEEKYLAEKKLSKIQ